MVVVEKISCGGKPSDDSSTVNEGIGARAEEDRGHPNPHSQWRKLDIPIFACEEAYGWTNRLDR